MGGDGGVIAVKRRYLRGCAENDERDKSQNLKDKQKQRARTCAQSSRVLSAPIVACRLGQLYNKEDLLNALIDKTLSSTCSHIRGLKDVREVHFTANPSYDAAGEKEGSLLPLFVCPITMLEFNGMNHFVFLWSTGHVLSSKALHEVGSAALQSEYGPFAESDIIPLLPPEEDIPLLREKLLLKQKTGKKRGSASTAIAERSAADRSDILAATITNTTTRPAATTTAHPNKKIKNNISNQCVLTNADSAIKTHEEKSSVYKSLFHKDDEKKKTGNDLFMTDRKSVV